jgi:hypothetical protein
LNQNAGFRMDGMRFLKYVPVCAGQEQMTSCECM